MNLYEKIRLREERERRLIKPNTLYVHYDRGSDSNPGTPVLPLLTYREANRRSRKKIDFIVIMKSSKTPDDIKAVAGT